MSNFVQSSNRYVVVLGDTHFGCRNFNQSILDFQVRFFRDFFFPFVQERGLKEVWQLGDLFDNRKVINASNFSIVTNEILGHFDEIFDVGVFLVGNHDTPYKSSVRDNWVSQIISRTVWRPGFEPVIVDTPLETPRASFVPWICKDNVAECNSIITKSGNTLVGHFEMSDFLMQRGVIAKTGMSADSFSGWTRVLSGHYHERSERDNILYTGVPYEMSWGEAYTPKGFYVYDTHEARPVEFIENPFKLFKEFSFSGTQEAINKDELAGCFVKIIREEGTDELAFERYVSSLTDDVSFAGLKIDRASSVIKTLEDKKDERGEVSGASTKDTLLEYCDEVFSDTSLNLDAMRALVLELYNEASFVVGETE